MGLSSRLLRLPRPNKFLLTLPLPSGASLITLSLLFNKLSGVYGILALLTGYSLSSLQLSMYIYSLVVLALTIPLSRHIKTQSPFHCLALAWLYILDSLINASYTALFGLTWFFVLAGQAHKAPMGAGSTINDTAGFSDPANNVSSVQAAGDGRIAGVDRPPLSTRANDTNPLAQVLDTQSIDSIVVISLLWTIRAYFCIIMLAWARSVVRQHIAAVSARTPGYSGTSTGKDGLLENPFVESRPEGQGWKGKAGRLMINIGKRYFLAPDQVSDDESWIGNMAAKFGRNKSEINNAVNARGQSVPLQKLSADTRPTERERRRRSGTGPPEPQANVQKGELGRISEEGNAVGGMGTGMGSAGSPRKKSGQ